jgi:anti-sigma B factor antagonist
MNLRITATHDPGGFQLEGELDLASVGILAPVLDAAVVGSTEITLDMSELTFMDSSGLALLLKTAGAMDGRGPLVLVSPTRAVLRVLEIALPKGAPGLEVRQAH